MASRPATVEDLLEKKALPTQEFTVRLGGEEVRIELQAINSPDYDELLAAHPPTKKQQESGDTYNTDTFAPALIAQVMKVPALTEAQAQEIWKGESWTRGELRDLFMSAVQICQQGLNVPFS